MKTKRSKQYQKPNVLIDEEFQALIPPLEKSERESLERSIVSAGKATAAIDVWIPKENAGWLPPTPILPLVIDGHNRLEICERLGLPFRIRTLDFPDRDAVKAWMFENQISRRNLSNDQVVMLASLRGIASDRGTARQREMARVLADAGKSAPVIAGKLSLALAFGAYARHAGLIQPRKYRARVLAETPDTGVPAGPSGALAESPPVQLAPGQELKRQTIQVNPDGTLRTRYDLSQTVRNPPSYETVPEGHLVTKTTTRIDADGRVGMQYVTAKPEEQARWRAIKLAVADMCANLREVPPTPEPVTGEDAAQLVAVYCFGDPHIGMLAWGHETGHDFDTKIAFALTVKVVNRLVAGAPEADTSLLVLIGDNYHADDDRQVTPGHGHKLDVDTRAARVFRVGCELWEYAIDRLLTKHKKVIVDVVKGNHDPQTAFYLSEHLRTRYRAEPRVTVIDNVREHHYHLFGKVLIGTTHGHKTRPDGLRDVMATDVPQWWAASEDGERHWISGHIHSKTWWDFRGCSLESLRTLAPADAYAQGAGYRSAQDAVVITYHTEHGEIGRNVVSPEFAGFKRARRSYEDTAI